MQDRYGRKINNLRISVTDRCNLRCFYCKPAGEVSLIGYDQILSYEEIVEVVRLAVGWGFKKFRLTGGEPLIRQGIVQLVEALAKLGIPDLSLTTNGTLLGKYAQDLKEAGLKRINIGLDTLKADKFSRITRSDCFHEVIRGLEVALKMGFSPVKINAILLKGINDDEILDFMRLTEDRPLEVRFIELMPFGGHGRWSANFISADEVKLRIERSFALEPMASKEGDGPAVRYKVEGHRGTLGLIAPVSNSFCMSCNRIRLTSDGHLRPCLFSDGEIDIKNPLHQGATDEELKALFMKAVAAKPQKHLLNGGPMTTKREMFQLGG